MKDITRSEGVALKKAETKPKRVRPSASEFRRMQDEISGLYTERAALYDKADELRAKLRQEEGLRFDAEADHRFEKGRNAELEARVRERFEVSEVHAILGTLFNEDPIIRQTFQKAQTCRDFIMIIHGLKTVNKMMEVQADEQANKSSPPAPAVEPVKEKDYDLTLVTVGENAIGAIKAIREVTGLGLKEAKDVVDSVCVMMRVNNSWTVQNKGTHALVLRGASHGAVKHAQGVLERVGCTVEVTEAKVRKAK